MVKQIDSVYWVHFSQKSSNNTKGRRRSSDDEPIMRFTTVTVTYGENEYSSIREKKNNAILAVMNYIISWYTARGYTPKLDTENKVIEFSKPKINDKIIVNGFKVENCDLNYYT